MKDRAAMAATAATGQFDALVAPHLPILYRVAYRLVRNPADAQDLVQDTCVAACENPADITAADHPVRWLLRVLHNCFIDGARRHGRAPFVALEEVGGSLGLLSDAPGPEELLQQADGEQALERAFLQLDAMQRTLLVLRAEGHDLGEIEAITGIGREVLRARLHRARRSLAQRLNEQTGVATLARAGSKS
jgi:RNA polymerase sigma-70 factor (ECF subfamily)